MCGNQSESTDEVQVEASLVLSPVTTEKNVWTVRKVLWSRFSLTSCHQLGKLRLVTLAEKRHFKPFKHVPSPEKSPGKTLTLGWPLESSTTKTSFPGLKTCLVLHFPLSCKHFEWGTSGSKLGHSRRGSGSALPSGSLTHRNQHLNFPTSLQKPEGTIPSTSPFKLMTCFKLLGHSLQACC